MATSPTPITPLPTPVPQRSDPANFAARGDALMVALPALVTETNAAGVATYDNAVEAATSAATSTSAATDAVAASSVALAAANFKGMWSSLTGALNKPASVKHNGRFWLLLNNLANVALSQPGVSSDWTSLDAGRVLQTITTNTVAVPGVYYVADAAGITLTVPTGWLNGDYLGGRNTSGGACFISWGANTLLDQVPDSPMRWSNNGKFETIFNGSTFV